MFASPTSHMLTSFGLLLLIRGVFYVYCWIGRINMSCNHMSCETLKFHHTHEEEQCNIGLASSLFTFWLCVPFRHYLLKALPKCGRFNQSVWSTYNNFLFYKDLQMIGYPPKVLNLKLNHESLTIHFSNSIGSTCN